jgi:hypothetical protein
MSDRLHRLSATTWASLAGFVLLAAFGWKLQRPAPFPAWFRSAPDAPRPLAEADYRKVFDPSLRVPTSALAALPACSPTPRPGTTEIAWEWTAPELPDSDALREIFPADATGLVTLPDGTRLALEAVALLLPSDAPVAGKPAGSVARVRPVWHHPCTGEPLPVPEPSPGVPGPSHPPSAWTATEQQLPTDRPRLLLRIRKEGTAPFRWHWPRAFDPRTFLTDSRFVSHSEDEIHGAFWLDLETWHQAPRRIAVGFAFGEPESRELPLRPGARVTLASGTTAECLGLHPGRFPSRSWGRAGTRSFASFVPDSSGKSSGERSAILWIWPPHHWEGTTLHRLSGALLHAEHGGFGRPVGTIHFPAAPGDEPPTLLLRKFPRLGLAVFDLPTVPRLPETKDLFAVPIPAATVGSLDEMLDLAKGAAGVTVQRSSGSVLTGSQAFPLTVTDTTPARLLEEWQWQSGLRLHPDPTAKHRLTDRPPPGLWEQMRELWEGIF